MEMQFGELMNNVRDAQAHADAECSAERDALVAAGWEWFNVAVLLRDGLKDHLYILAVDANSAETEAMTNSFVVEVVSVLTDDQIESA